MRLLRVLLDNNHRLVRQKSVNQKLRGLDGAEQMILDGVTVRETRFECASLRLDRPLDTSLCLSCC